MVQEPVSNKVKIKPDDTTLRKSQTLVQLANRKLIEVRKSVMRHAVSLVRKGNDG
jgi:hypothetical protein